MINSIKKFFCRTFGKKQSAIYSELYKKLDSKELVARDLLALAKKLGFEVSVDDKHNITCIELTDSNSIVIDTSSRSNKFHRETFAYAIVTALEVRNNYFFSGNERRMLVHQILIPQTAADISFAYGFSDPLTMSITFNTTYKFAEQRLKTLY